MVKSKKDSSTNPPSTGAPWVIVGLIKSPHGIRGEIAIEPFSDTPGRFGPDSVLFIQEKAYRVQRCFALRSGMGLKLEGVDSREAAEELRSQTLNIPTNQVPVLPAGRYYHFQLIGIQVSSVQGEYLGILEEILNTGSNDVYVVRDNQQEVLLPALETVISSIDIKRNSMLVNLLPGLR